MSRQDMSKLNVTNCLKHVLICDTELNEILVKRKHLLRKLKKLKPCKLRQKYNTPDIDYIFETKKSRVKYIKDRLEIALQVINEMLIKLNEDNDILTEIQTLHNNAKIGTLEGLLRDQLTSNIPETATDKQVSVLDQKCDT